MLGCGTRGGIWLDNDAAQRVTQHFSERVIQLANAATQSAQRRPDVRAVAKCGACRTEMKRRTFGEISIDYCEAHGTWFDAGELAAMLEPMRPVPQYPQPVYQDTPSSGLDIGDAIALGAFEFLVDILTD